MKKSKSKNPVLFFILCGIVLGALETILVNKGLNYIIPLGESAGFFITAAIVDAALMVMLAVILYILPFTCRLSRPLGMILLAVCVIGLITAIIQPGRKPVIAQAFADINKPNIILITLDTAGRKHISLYGYHRNTTPNLDRISAEGVVFNQAVSPSPWTLPGHACMFTGLLPSEHGATWRSQYLASSVRTLAEVLTEKGYHTAGFVCGPFCGGEFGLDQGFQFYDEQLGSLKIKLYSVRIIDKIWGLLEGETGSNHIKRFLSQLEGYPKYGKRPADLVNKRVLHRMNGKNPDTPYFLFVNYFDPHQPFIIKPPYDTLFTQKYKPSPSDTLMKWHHQYEPERRKYINGESMPAEFLARQKAFEELGCDLYDALIYFMDEKMNELLIELRKMGLLDNTYIIITADHGEGLGEHRQWGHYTLYDEILLVPLVIIGPGIPSGVKVDKQVTTMNLYHTILRLLQIENESFIEEKSLSFLWEDTTLSGGEPVYGQFYMDTNLVEQFGGRFDNDAVMLRIPEMKLIIKSDGIREKYGLLSDPEEVNNIIDSASYTNLDTLLENFYDISMEYIDDVQGHVIDAETREKLKAVGYMK
ncbi:sulfatase [bacterium]|nr:sulfatase [FCB group bacterium]MBL7190578.1 sulfatase [bacterium]